MYDINLAAEAANEPKRESSITEDQGSEPSASINSSGASSGHKRGGEGRPFGANG